MKSNLALAILTLIVFGYIFSYVLIRNNNTFLAERDGCPSEGCIIVYLPQGKFCTFYKSLIFIDQWLTPSSEFIFTDKELKWN